jgi:RecA-family ATPase
MANFNQLMQHAAQPNNWLIEDLLLHSDQLMIAAAPKAGKSLLAIQLAIAVASGGEFLRWKVKHPAKVLYLNLEIGEAPFAQRVQKQAAALSPQELVALGNNLEVISNLRTIDIEAPADYGTVQSLVVLHKPQLVIFDVLARCHSQNENDNSTMKFVLQQLRKVVGTAATVVVHHSRKAPQGMEDANLGPSSMRGASAVHGEVDLAITLTKRAAKDGKFSMRFSARNVNEPDEMFLDRDDATLLLAEVAPASGQKASQWAAEHGVPLRSLASWCAHAARWQARLDGVTEVRHFKRPIASLEP